MPRSIRQQLLPQSPVCSVRADSTIAECARILRAKGLGALIVMSDDGREEIVGVFTERDLVKNIELIHRGAFWETPVRTVMTSVVRTVSVEELHLAPRMMAQFNIRHLPVVVQEKGRRRVVGVLSMRDLFRITMEAVNYDLGKVLFPPEQPQRQRPRKLVGVFSTDPAIQAVVDQGARNCPHFVVKSAVFREGLASLREYFEMFDVLFVDIDGVPETQILQLLAQARGLKAHRLYVAFSPTLLSSAVRLRLHEEVEKKSILTLSKPIALGLLMEKFLREI